MSWLTFSSDWHIDVNNNKGEFIEAYKDFEGLLIIAGDFAEVRNRDSIFFEAFEDLFEINPLIYVAFICGNHEYYGNTVEKTHELIFEWVEEEDMDRFIFLESDYNLYWEDYFISGATLWYPDTVDSWLLQNNINDFSEIVGFNPSKAHELNSFAHSVFDDLRPSINNKIWVTHHLPSVRSVDGKFRGDRLNCYFVDPTFEKLIEKHKPKFVIHGHAHKPVRYKIGETWILSNPKGYKFQNKLFNPLAYLIDLGSNETSDT